MADWNYLLIRLIQLVWILTAVTERLSEVLRMVERFLLVDSLHQMTLVKRLYTLPLKVAIRRIAQSCSRPP